ncbi:hypothetical protein [Shewanella sp. CG12_big_fil_rev_8_21_14_0_65_47_15]|uniref:hypothetical protein n=1 Tax=Shewanella sp. CG12_big_fil_rev_8_21_14_0_65_47_15 TaxID=1975537 RepID=UPI000CB4224C|nr:hypothetical protein [Shewanella sp. CG12_big_fil_rev_8_21_14_0_65_47_15]PIW61800.1 MAG: hypothetical protein COW15_06360 [Shewanella sp. CG12_big_fil_rev_8_21_14_0_65_47_15]
MREEHISEKRFWVQRLSKTILRALHILGVVGAGGGILLAIDKSLWLNYWYLAMATGSILMFWEIVRDWRWLIQLKGVLTLVKLGLLGLFVPLANFKPELLIVILFLSVIVSHGPAGLRHYSIVHRRQINSKKEIKG